jgi:hypothetical protein
MAGKINITNSSFGIIKDNICSDGIYIDGVKVSDSCRNFRIENNKFILTLDEKNKIDEEAE